MKGRAIALLVLVTSACRGKESASNESPQTAPSRPGEERVGEAPKKRITKRTQWDVTWTTITGEGKAGAPVGTSTFGGTFDKDWGKGPVFGEYNDYVAFKAIATINMPRTGVATFRVGSDDGTRLLLDHVPIIDNWRTGSYQEKSVKVDVSPGKHTLTLEYFEKTKNARVSFDCDHDLLVWEESE